MTITSRALEPSMHFLHNQNISPLMVQKGCVATSAKPPAIAPATSVFTSMSSKKTPQCFINFFKNYEKRRLHTHITPYSVLD